MKLNSGQIGPACLSVSSSPNLEANTSMLFIPSTWHARQSQSQHRLFLVINFIYNAKKTNSYLILTVEVDSPSTQWAAVTTQ